MAEEIPEVYDPWWDTRHDDEYTDELEWTPVHSDISDKKE